MTKIETVSILYRPPKVLLGMKKIRFGKGRYNGFGGGLEDYETLEESAIRETLDESGMLIENPERMGKILFEFKENNEPDHLVHFFRALKFSGTPKESNEMKPEWFHIDKIPYDLMWEDDKYWMPLLLKGQKFEGNFWFNNEFKIIKNKLNLVDKLD